MCFFVQKACERQKKWLSGHVEHKLQIQSVPYITMPCINLHSKHQGYEKPNFAQHLQ